MFWLVFQTKLLNRVTKKWFDSTLIVHWLCFGSILFNMGSFGDALEYEGHPINSGNFFIIRMLVRLAYQNYIVSMAKHVAHIIHYQNFISRQ